MDYVRNLTDNESAKAECTICNAKVNILKFHFWEIVFNHSSPAMSLKHQYAVLPNLDGPLSKATVLVQLPNLYKSAFMKNHLLTV